MSCPHSSRPDASPTSCTRCILNNRVYEEDMVPPRVVQIQIIDGWIHENGVNVGRFDDRNTEQLKDQSTYAGVAPSLRKR